MRFKDYGRNPKLRKAFVQNKGLLIVGVDIGKKSHTACCATRQQVLERKFNFDHCRAGFTALEKRIRSLRFKSKCKRVLVGMEPSGLYWYALYARLKHCGFNVCLVNCLAVKNNRRTMPDGSSKTDPKDAHSIYDLLTQGKFFLPVERDSELNAAYRMMRRHMALTNRIARLRNQLRGIIHLSFPELNAVIKDLTLPTSLRFLVANPTPQSIMRNGRKRFMAKWQPRRRCGQWTPAKFATIYDLAKTSIGLKDPQRIDALEIKLLAQDLADAVQKSQFWLDQAVKLLEHREDFALLMSMPRIGKPTATALLTAIGHIDEFTCGKQLVKLAGLDIREYESGTSIKKSPRVSHVGSGYLRHWLYHYALRLVAVSDKILRIVYRMLQDKVCYTPGTDRKIAAYYKEQQKAA